MKYLGCTRYADHPDNGVIGKNYYWNSNTLDIVTRLVHVDEFGSKIEFNPAVYSYSEALDYLKRNLARFEPLIDVTEVE